MNHATGFAFVFCWISITANVWGDDLPFQHTVEVYRNDEEQFTAFALRLEQPFLAEEFEKSSYLRLRSDDPNAYLIYPKETQFEQKHAEFYGRLKGDGPVTVKLSYETVSENLDGSRRVQVREGTIEISIPKISADKESTGPRQIFQDWAKQQNLYFARMLSYYPNETFFQYCLLQSRARYGIEPPPIVKSMPSKDGLETGLYKLFSGSLAMQESLQRLSLGSSETPDGGYNTHVSAVTAPRIKSLDYEQLLTDKREQGEAKIQVHEISGLVPADQYFLHFNSFHSLMESFDLISQLGDDLLRLQKPIAQDNRLLPKLQRQLGIDRNGMETLFQDGALTEVAVTGSDPYLLDGTDITLIAHVGDHEKLSKQTTVWNNDLQEQNPDLVERNFNYRGHLVTARYTNDRLVSSFTTKHDDYVVFSNSHRAIRHVIDASTHEIDRLRDSHDYQYVSTILPPSKDESSGYYYASDAFVRRIVGPEAKISQKRRIECFNNLVMQNNASLFFRLEYGRSPNSLSEMIEKRFIAPEKMVCPHGGAYSFDADSDTCTCSLHNRLRYLTPNAELTVLNVSDEEVKQYERYKQRYSAFWKPLFDPVATRITVAPRVRLETCILPFANSNLYGQLRKTVQQDALPIRVDRIASSAVASIAMAAGRKNTASFLTTVPGMAKIIAQDPTLTDLEWIGDRVSLHFCDGEIIYEIDPTQLTPINLPMIGSTPAGWQALVGTLVLTANLPVYATVDVENTDKAQHLLEQVSSSAFLMGGKLGPLTTKMDSYRLPDYREHKIYVVSARLHAIAVRLHIALVGNQIVIATKPEILREVIDTNAADPKADGPRAHFLFRLNRLALDHLQDDVQLHWAEKSRLACHRNIISIHNFHQLYNAPIDEIAALSEAKYGIRYYCPEDGEYSFDTGTSQITCSVHGNRESSRQPPTLNPDSSSARFIQSINEIVAYGRFEEDALITTVEIDRRRQNE